MLNGNTYTQSNIFYDMFYLFPKRKTKTYEYLRIAEDKNNFVQHPYC